MAAMTSGEAVRVATALEQFSWDDDGEVDALLPMGKAFTAQMTVRLLYNQVVNMWVIHIDGSHLISQSSVYYLGFDEALAVYQGMGR